MILRATIKNIRLTFSIAKIAKIMGVNSKLDDCKGCPNFYNGSAGWQCSTNEKDCHILMWDFDKQKLEDIKKNLKVIQVRYFLSDIHILETNHEEGNFIAYCFTRTPWRRAVEIVSATYGVDWQFIRISVFRGWFTLRTGAKKSGIPHIVARLDGYQLADCDPSDLQNWVEYETLDKE
jgi:hypothetical protein